VSILHSFQDMTTGWTTDGPTSATNAYMTRKVDQQQVALSTSKLTLGFISWCRHLVNLTAQSPCHCSPHARLHFMVVLPGEFNLFQKCHH